MTRIKGMTVLLLLWNIALHAQEGFLILKKRKTNLVSYFKGSHIVLQLNSRQWVEGVITKLSADSIEIAQEILRYNGPVPDTLHYYHTWIAIKDVYALPTKRELINHDPGGNINVIPGHEKFVWIRNGFIFRVLGAGYAGLNIGNHLIDKDPPFASDNLGPPLAAAAGVFLFGELLQQLYHPHWRLGKKYHFQYIPLSDKKAQQAKPRGF